MRVRRDDGLAIAWMPTKLVPPQLVGVFLCKATFALTRSTPAKAVLDGALPCGDLVDSDLIYPSDFVPYKPRADVLVRAQAHAPAGEPVRYAHVAIKVGQLEKRLLVAGDRRWKLGLFGRSPSDPEPFRSIPITWTRAFGGPKDENNPIGRGRDSDLLPNIEFPDRQIQSPSDRIPPAGLGPIPADWAPRRSCIGTYGGNYLKERWPWYPEDFDFGYFNAAPRDQQVEGHLRGDEELRFENLHRQHRLLETKLPGLRPRLFLTFDDGEFREVPQRLDTLFCDLEQDRIVLVWRGHTDIRNPMMREVVQVFAALEPLDEPQDAEHYRRLRDVAPAVEQEAPPAPAAAAAEAQSRQEIEARVAAMQKELAEAEAMVAAQSAANDRRLVEQGIDPMLLRAKAQPQDLAGVQGQLTQEIERLRKEHPDLKLPAQVGVPDAELTELDQMVAGFEQPAQQMQRQPAWTRATVLAALAHGRSLAGEDLSGLDLSDCQLAGAKLDHVTMAACDLRRADLAGANLSASVLVDAKLDGANLSGATLDGADLTGAALAGVSLAGASLARAVLEQQRLAGADLSGCRGEAVQFAGADLSGCKLTGADFSKGDFLGCKLIGADCTGSTFRDARLHAADASRANFQKADLRGMRANDGANFAGADFRHARADGVVFEFANLHGADLRYASLQRALLTGSDFGQCDLSRADLHKASLADASLVGARLLQTNLLYASLERCDLKGADLRQANLFGAGLWETKTELADLREANLASTLQAKR